MRFALVQATTPASATTQDYTDANISSDWKGALFFSGNSSANNTVDNDCSFSEGTADGTTQRLCGVGGPNGAASAGAMSTFNHSSTSACAGVSDNNSATPNVLGAYSSTLSNGVRVNYTTTVFQALMNALLVSGSDVEFKVVNQTLGTGSSPVTTSVTHGLSGGAPHAIICLASLSGVRETHGFYDVGNNTYGCSAYCNINGVNPTLVGGYVGDDCIGAQVSNSAVTYKLTVTNVGATTFDAVATGTIEADVITFICIRITDGVYKVGVATAPTGTGTAALVSGMSVSPDLVLMAMSRMTTVNTFDGGDAAGVYGFGAAVDNNGSTQQACSSLSSDDGATTSIEKSYTSNTKCVAIMDAAGAIDIEAAHSSWDSGGVTLNWTNVNTAVLIPYLAIGQSASAGGPVWPQIQQHPTQRSALLRM